MNNNSKYFKNTECEYFPCHKTDGDFFNCMFCYCPLYSFGDKCGGNFEYTEDGIKDCSKCLIPHSRDGYSYVLYKLQSVDFCLSKIRIWLKLPTVFLRLNRQRKRSAKSREIKC